MTHPTVVLETNLGNIRIELFAGEAPVSTENFLSYVDGGFYDGLIFHRFIPDFMVQTGGHEPDLRERAVTAEPIVNESDNGLTNLKGTVAMARMQPPHSARAQFFVNLVDNPMLDYGARPGGWGYAVFGRVIEGMEVVEEIAIHPTGSVDMYQDVPIDPVIIASARRSDDVVVTPPSLESVD
ncbi:MAG: peptidyl-prolyl cis-trans isomerase [Gemmatimonadales bacterium]|nr:MAG: peptidyl-prolyl cis-trans isomerase [Gemmatimonadales bacterium]